MPRLVLTPSAVRGLDRCRAFLAEKSPAATRRATAAIRQALSLLERSPEIGRPVDGGPMRLLVIPFAGSGYAALYRHEPESDLVVVLAFRHQKEAGF